MPKNQLKEVNHIGGIWLHMGFNADQINTQDIFHTMNEVLS